jgi:regulator of protease activity HflC (stomatin/prohibitin superfamily)
MFAVFIYGVNSNSEMIPALLSCLWIVMLSFVSAALKVIQPNQALVLVLFGKYYGTLSQPGFYMVNPLTTKKKLSLKARTLNNEKQKVNDEDGNPIEIGVVVIWRVSDTALSSFAVEDFMEFVSTQTDSAIRNVARQYPYDISAAGTNELSLRGSSEEVSLVLKEELQQRVDIAGIEIMEARISHLAYAPEIAAAMLQRQQAAAIIAARQMIVEGAVGMVEMALDKLAANKVVELDEERKAQMVSNLLVVLCGDKATQPVINTSSIY